MSTDTKLQAEEGLEKARVLTRSGRKFTDEDLQKDPDLYVAAWFWAQKYEGSFSFMLDMKARVLRNDPLSIPQARAVLNCFAAEITRKTESNGHTPVLQSTAHPPVRQHPATTSVEQKVLNGTYIIQFENGEYRTLRLEDCTWTDCPKGSQIASYLTGPDNGSDFTGFATVYGDHAYVWKRFQGGLPQIRKALQVLLESPNSGELGLAYAMRSGNCYRCGRMLTVPTSLHRGLGPVCAEKVGV